MKQNKSQLTGTGKVFSFTFLQFFKNKGNIFSMIFLLLLTLASVPVMTLIGGGSTKKAEHSEIQNVYYVNETGIPITEQLIQELIGDDPYFANAVFIPADGITENMTDFDVCVVFDVQEATEELPGGYGISLTTTLEPAVSDEDLEMLQSFMTDVFDNARLSALNITDDQLAVLMSGWNVETEDLSEYLNPEDENKWSTQYFIQLAYAIIVMMVSIFSVSYIARAVVEEKSSKLVELLMVSVKPLALIVGKILAALAYVIVLFGMLIAGYGISYYVTGLFLDVSATGNLFSQIGFSTDLLQAGPFLILAILISLLLGFLTFAIVAGLSASGCSTTEDMQSAMSASTFLIMAGYLVSIFAGSADIPIVNQIVSLIPVISVYCAPVNFIMGNIGPVMLILSWILQIVVIVLLALFCARIYENLLMYRGNRVKLTQMISMAKEPRARKEEN